MKLTLPRLARAAGVAVLALVVVSARAESHSLLRPAGPQFDVVAGTSTAPAAALDGFGRATVAWAELGESARLWARTYDPLFRPHGRPWLVQEAAAPPFGWRVTATRRGRVLVTWSEGSPDAPVSAYKLFEADGKLLAKNDLGSGHLAGPVWAAADAGGRFVLAWKERAGIYAQLLDADGVTRVARFRVANGASGVLDPRAVVADAAGAFIVFWRDSTQEPARYHGLHFDAGGAAHGVPFELPGVDAAADVRGHVAVAWVDGAGARPRVLLQRLTPAGAAVGPAVQVNADAWADQPRLAADGAGNFVVAFRGPSGTGSDVFARRYTSDGDPDAKPFALASAASDANEAIALAGSPTGDVLATWLHAVPRAPVLQARAFRVPIKGDLDGDLRSDLLLRRERDGVTRVWTMREGRRESNTRIWRQTPGPDWTLVSADDFNGDRRQDLVFRHDGTGAVYFSLLGGQWGTEVRGGAWLHPPGPGGAKLVATGDFDADGWPDLVWHDAATHRVSVWTMEGTQHVGTLTPTPDSVPDASWELLGAHDWDGDGTRDLLWHDGATDTLVQWLIDRDLARVSARALDPPAASGSEWHVVAAGDYGVGPYGATGTADVVWRNARTKRQVIWFLDADGRRTSGIFTTPVRPSGVVVLAGPR